MKAELGMELGEITTDSDIADMGPECEIMDNIKAVD